MSQKLQLQFRNKHFNSKGKKISSIFGMNINPNMSEDRLWLRRMWSLVLNLTREKDPAAALGPGKKLNLNIRFY